MSDIRDISDLLKNDSFVKWIKGDSDPVEAGKWEAWSKSSSKNQDLAREAQFIIESLAEMEPDPPDPSIYLRRFQDAMAQSESEKQLWNFPEYHRRTVPLYLAIAASILIMIAAGIVIYGRVNSENQSKQELATVRKFKTDFGQKTSLMLSDGSRIILNANSEMTFSNKVRSKNEINVWLKGEAYFQIKHHTGQAKRIFKVHTKDGTVTDVGTRFSVNTRSDSTAVALVEGAVNITMGLNSDQQSKNQSDYSMKPGELALFAKGGKQIRIEKVNPAVYTSWISNKLTFDHTPLAMAARRIEDTYGVKVIISDKRLLNKSISGLVRNNNLNALIDGLSKILHVPVRQVNNKVIVG